MVKDRNLIYEIFYWVKIGNLFILNSNAKKEGTKIKVKTWEVFK